MAKDTVDPVIEPTQSLDESPVIEPGKGSDELPVNEPEKGIEELPESIKKRALVVFDSHDVSEIFFTSDGTAFIEPQHAQMHAESLEDHGVLTVNRQEV